MSVYDADGEVLKVGSTVCFKSDVEQVGTIVAIAYNIMGHAVLTLENESGFEGEYIGGQTRTQELAQDCWVD